MDITTSEFAAWTFVILWAFCGLFVWSRLIKHSGGEVDLIDLFIGILSAAFGPIFVFMMMIVTVMHFLLLLLLNLRIFNRPIFRIDF